MTVTDIINGLVSDRTLAVTSKKSLIGSLPPVENKTTFLEKYLFGDGTYPGIADIMGLLYHELFLLEGSVLYYPETFNATSWQAEFITAAEGSDGADGLYPSGVQTLNLASPWLTTNGYTLGTTGIIGTDIPGVSAAVAALITKRTEDTSIPADGVADTPDYYSDPEALNLTSAIASLLANLIAYRSHLTAYFNITTVISTNPLFSNAPDMTAVVESFDIDEIQINLGTAISTLTAFSGYFTTYVSSPLTRDAFDLKLTDLTSFLTGGLAGITGLTTTLTDRYWAAEDQLSINDLGTGLRKWMVFWIKLLVGKPMGTYIVRNGILLATAQAVSDLIQQRTFLETFFGNNLFESTRYLSTPKCGVYANEGKAVLLLQTIPAATQFKVYRKALVPTVSIDDTQWTDTSLIGTIASEVSVFTWEETLPVTSGWYAYRFSIQDVGVDMVDTYATGSLQSNILGDAFAFTGFTAMTVTSVGHSLSVGDTILLETSDTSMVTSVESKTADTITLVGVRPGTALVSLGTITKLSGVLYVS